MLEIIKKRKISVCVIILIVSISGSFLAGYFIDNYLTTQKMEDFLKNFKPLRQKGLDYFYISPLIGIESEESTKIGIFSDIKQDVNNNIKKYESEGKLTDEAVYFRDLNSSTWFGINEDEEFFPASLLKLTYALAAYKEDEDTHQFLNKRFLYTKEIDDLNKTREAADKTALVVGQDYSVKDLIQIMITNSDNSARDAIDSIIDKKYLLQIFRLLGVKEPDPTRDFMLSAKDYALFLRVLYGATFLNNDHSEELLKMMTKTDFSDGIVKELPTKVMISHKWGVHDFFDEKGKLTGFEVHDCGIIYNGSNPYLLCIMTKGIKSEDLLSFISTTSQIIFSDLNNQ